MERAQKRPNGSGSVEQRPDGRWRVRVVIDGKRRQLGVWPDRATAERKLEVWLAARGEGLIEAPSETTVASYGLAWLERREIDGSKQRARVKTIGAEYSIWRRHVAPSALGHLAIDAVTPRHVEAFARALRNARAVDAIVRGRGSKQTTEIRETGRALSRSMQIHALRIVRQVLAQATVDGLLASNPAADVGVAVGGQRPRDLSDDWLRADEIAKLLACGKISDRDRTVYACALGLALRLNDLKRIELAHVRLDDEVPGPHVQVWIEKSERWHRVPVLPWLLPWLRSHIATLERGERFLFPAPDGVYGKSYDFGWSGRRQRLASGRGPARSTKLVTTPRVLEVVGVERRIRFHDLRGTTATHLALGTWGRVWSLQEVQQMLAHSDQRVTERYVRRAVDALATAAAGTLGVPALPPVAPEGAEAIASLSLFFRHAPAVSRTRDLSLRKLGPREAGDGVAPDMGSVWAALVHDALEAMQRDDREAALQAFRELAARHLMSDRAAAAALEVLEDGPHAVMAGLRLIREVESARLPLRGGWGGGRKRPAGSGP